MTKKLIATGTLFVCAAIAQLAMVAAQIPTHIQANTTAIHGSVTDPSGAVIPSAMVTISSGAFTRTVSTDDSGQYTFTGIETGHYRVRVHFGGFTPFDRANFLVTPGQVTEVNAQMELREARQTVTVYE